MTGLLIAGGDGDFQEASVEVYVPSTGYSCSLPSLPHYREDHTMTGMTVCGGAGLEGLNQVLLTSCISFLSGEWVTSHSLPEERWYHNSWVMGADSILLLGGLESPDTTDVVSEGVYEGGQGFRMESSTM